MKEFKKAIVDRIILEAEGSRIVSLHDVGLSLGRKHISTQDCRDIISAALKELPGYKVVKMVAPGQSEATASLWTTATFVDCTLKFDDGPAAPDAPDTLPDALFSELWSEALASRDLDAYISSQAASSAWGGDADAEAPEYRVEMLSQIWNAAHLSIKDIRAHTGLSQAAFASRYCIPRRTVEDWERGVSRCPDYLRLLLARDAGLYARP